MQHQSVTNVDHLDVLKDLGLNARASVQFDTPGFSYSLDRIERRDGHILDRLLLVSWGDLSKKLRPAIGELGRQQQITAVGVCDVRQVCPQIDGQTPRVFIIRDNLLPLDELHDAGLLNRNTLAYLACPGQYRAHYASVLAPHVGRVACEKPVDLSVTAARGLRSFSNVFPVVHSLFKEPLHSLPLTGWGNLPSDWYDRVWGVEVWFAESGAAPTSLREDAFTGMQVHTQTAAFWLARHAMDVSQITVDQAFATTATSNGKPNRATAAAVTGQLIGDRKIEYLSVAGWGLIDRKTIIVHLIDGRRVSVDWNESGWKPHLRVLHQLLSPEPDLLVSMPHAVSLLELCMSAARESVPVHSNSAGRLPLEFARLCHRWSLLSGGMPDLQSQLHRVRFSPPVLCRC